MHGMGSEGIPPEQNNALRAAELFTEKFGTNGADIVVYKNIPMGAGLGGSSADAAGTLRALAMLYGVKEDSLNELADSLGSDVRYMLRGGFCRMRGRGEIVEPVHGAMPLHFLLICPQTPVSTSGCYKEYDSCLSSGKIAHIDESATQNCIDAFCANDINGVGRYLMNDLYAPATRLNDDVKIALEEAKSFSPLGCSMSGSGSCVFALFETKELCDWAKSRYRGKYRVYTARTVPPHKTIVSPFVIGDEV
jgi:4-diphosphocytidyl-2-C-methyl-D-erythritol kinase